MQSDSTVAGKKVVIVGCGFAGLHCALWLAKHSDAKITVIDRNNYQQFKPLMYQVATASLPATDAAFNLRSVLAEHANVDIVMGEITSVDPAAKTAHDASGEAYTGDYLVLAAGADANFFHTAGAAEHAFPMYTLQDAERLRARILEILEKADHDIAQGQQRTPHFAIVGGGPTGVEIAGALADIFQGSPQFLFKHLDMRTVKITIINGRDEILTGFRPASQKYAEEVLRQRGVEMMLKCRVKEVTETEIVLDNETRLACDLTVWAGGLKAAALAGNMSLTQGKGGRIDVRDDLQIEGYPGVYALGDFANQKAKDGSPLPQLGSVAQQAGQHCAHNILASMKDGEQKPFVYVDKGIMAMVGRNAAVAEVGSGHHSLTGPIAFAAWLGVHALLLTTAHAKISAFFTWAWNYFGNAHVEALLDGPSSTATDSNSPSA